MRELQSRNSKIRALAQKCKRLRERIKELTKERKKVKRKKEDSEKVEVVRKELAKFIQISAR